MARKARFVFPSNFPVIFPVHTYNARYVFFCFCAVFPQATPQLSQNRIMYIVSLYFPLLIQNVLLCAFCTFEKWRIITRRRAEKYMSRCQFCEFHYSDGKREMLFSKRRKKNVKPYCVSASRLCFCWVFRVWGFFFDDFVRFDGLTVRKITAV